METGNGVWQVGVVVLWAYTEVICRLLVVVDGLFQVGNVTLVNLGNGLVVLGGNREPPHVRVNVDALGQTTDRL